MEPVHSEPVVNQIVNQIMNQLLERDLRDSEPGEPAFLEKTPYRPFHNLQNMNTAGTKAAEKHL
jgi:hypothetical protein